MQNSLKNTKEILDHKNILLFTITIFNHYFEERDKKLNKITNKLIDEPNFSIILDQLKLGEPDIHLSFMYKIIFVDKINSLCRYL